MASAPCGPGLNHAEVGLWQDWTLCPALAWTDYLRVFEKDRVAELVKKKGKYTKYDKGGNSKSG